METKVCKVCGRELPIENFKTNPRYGRSSVCNECVTKKRMANKEKKSELNTLREQCLAAKDMRLHEFTPRELMIELKRRGYEFTMTYTETKTISSKMLSNKKRMKSIKEKAEEYGYTNWQSDEYHDGASEGLEFDAIGHTQKTFEAGANYVLDEIEKLTNNQNWCAFPKQSHKELKELIERLKSNQ